MSTIVVGFQGKLYKGGTPTSFTNEATTQVGVTKEYQITAASKRAVDPATAVVIKDNGVTVSPANYTLNLMKGSVTFIASYSVTGPVLFGSGKYIPRSEIAKVKNFDGSPKLDTTDCTMVGSSNSSGYEQRIPTVFKFDGKFTIYDYLSAQSLDTYVSGKTPILLELDFDGTATGVTRAWVLLENAAGPIKPKDVNEVDVKFGLYDQALTANALNGCICNAAFDFVTT